MKIIDDLLLGRESCQFRSAADGLGLRCGRSMRGSSSPSVGTAWAASFGFGELEARPKPSSGRDFERAWPGLAHGLKPGRAHH